MTTPLLAALSKGFPEARIDWAVSDWALPAIGVNSRITRTIRTGPGDLDSDDRDELRTLIERLRSEAYDTCFIPSPSRIAVQIAGQGEIPRLFGFNRGRRGAARKMIQPAPPEGRLLARRYLSLAAAAGVDQTIIDEVEMEFEPPDVDRTSVARWLVEEFDWLGDRPLVVLHPGGGQNPSQTNLDKRWPAERFARLGNYLARVHDARVVVVGLAEERALAAQLIGMMSPAKSGRVANRAGEIGLGELGALCELATLYVSNDIGSSCVAAATGCPTLVIFGPTDPAVTGPYMVNGRVICLGRAYEGPFTWANGVTVDEAIAAAERLLMPLTAPSPNL